MYFLILDAAVKPAMYVSPSMYVISAMYVIPAESGNDGACKISGCLFFFGNRLTQCLRISLLIRDVKSVIKISINSVSLLKST